MERAILNDIELSSFYRPPDDERVGTWEAHAKTRDKRIFIGMDPHSEKMARVRAFEQAELHHTFLLASPREQLRMIVTRVADRRMFDDDVRYAILALAKIVLEDGEP